MPEVQRVHEAVEEAAGRRPGPDRRLAAEEGAARAFVDVGHVEHPARGRVVPDEDAGVGAAVVGDADVGDRPAGAGRGVGEDVVEAGERRRRRILGHRRLEQRRRHRLLVAAEGDAGDEREADGAGEAEERSGEGEQEGEGKAPARREHVPVAHRGQPPAGPLGEEQVADQVAVHQHAGDHRRHHHQPEDAGQDQAPGVGQVELHVQLDQELAQGARLPGGGLVPDEAVVAVEGGAGPGVDAEHGAEVVLEPGLRVQGMGVEEDVQVGALARPHPDVVQVFGVDLAGELADPGVDRHVEGPGLARRSDRPAPDLVGEDRDRAGGDDGVEQEAEDDGAPAVDRGEPLDLGLRQGAHQPAIATATSAPWTMIAPEITSVPRTRFSSRQA